MARAERSSYTPLDFRDWQESDSLVLSPKFQRRGVWTAPARSYLVESLLLGMPVPPLYLRVAQDEARRRLVREVIDGQQRIAAVLDFMKGKYALSGSVDDPLKGKQFSELTRGERKQIEEYSFSCEVFHGIEDSEVLQIFARLNTHSVKLNAQELRNGKFFGPFKRLAYELAVDHLEFWRTNRVFSERGIARMAEVELTSELMILALDGLQDKKKSIDDFYARLDDSFPDRDIVASRFRATIDAINEACGDILRETEFRRPPLFYTVFGALYHRMFGIAGVTLPTEARERLIAAERNSTDRALRHLSDLVAAYKLEKSVPAQYQGFVVACLRQTDNLRPRRVRLETLYRLAFDS